MLDCSAFCYSFALSLDHCSSPDKCNFVEPYFDKSIVSLSTKAHCKETGFALYCRRIHKPNSTQ